MRLAASGQVTTHSKLELSKNRLLVIETDHLHQQRLEGSILAREDQGMVYFQH